MLTCTEHLSQVEQHKARLSHFRWSWLSDVLRNQEQGGSGGAGEERRWQREDEEFFYTVYPWEPVSLKKPHVLKGILLVLFHVYGCPRYVCFLRRTEEGVWSSGTGVRDGLGPPCRCWESNLLQEQLVLYNHWIISPFPLMYLLISVFPHLLFGCLQLLPYLLVVVSHGRIKTFKNDRAILFSFTWNVEIFSQGDVFGACFCVSLCVCVSVWCSGVYEHVCASVVAHVWHVVSVSVTFQPFL